MKKDFLIILISIMIFSFAGYNINNQSQNDGNYFTEQLQKQKGIKPEDGSILLNEYDRSATEDGNFQKNNVGQEAMKYHFDRFNDIKIRTYR